MLEIPQANRDNTKYGKRSKQDVKSPPRHLSEFPVICFHTSMINWQKAVYLSLKYELDLYCKHPPITLYLECLAVLIIHLVIVWIQSAFIQVFQPVFDFAWPFVTL